MHSLDARKATGAINNTIPVDKSAPKEIIFNLRQSGEKLKLKEVAEDPEEAKRRAAEGPAIDHVALKKDDLIFHSLEARKATGAINNTVPSTNKANEVLFKLRSKGEMPKLKEVAEDPDELKRKEAEGPVVDHAALKRDDVIMHSLDSRKATGAINNTIPVDKNAPKEIVFTLR
jgi:hypothetical protein